MEARAPGATGLKLLAGPGKILCWISAVLPEKKKKYKANTVLL